MIRNFTLALMFIFISSMAIASQKARIGVDSANIYSEPQESSEVLDTLSLGTSIEISNNHKDGWYRIRANNGKLGWIFNTQVAFDNNSMTKAASIDLAAQHRFRVERKLTKYAVRVSVPSYSFSSIDIGGFHNSYAYSYGLHIDGIFRMQKKLYFTFRTGYYQTPSASNKYFTSYRYGFPALAGFEFGLYESHDWQIGGLLLLGGNFTTVHILPASGKANPASTSSVRTDFLSSATFLFKYKMAKSYSLFGESGIYYSYPQGGGIANVPFMNGAGNPTSITKKFTGILLSFGAEFTL